MEQASATQPRRGRSEPLWDRIERNRVRTGAFMALFIGGAAASGALFVGVSAVFLGVVLVAPSGTIDYFRNVPWMILAAFVAGGALAAFHIVRSLDRPEQRLPGEFGAVPSQSGSLPATESALADMAIAAGRRGTPQLWLIDDCERINAFALGLHDSGTIVGVTQGLVDRLSEDDQRAVFANLMARVTSGYTFSATAISAIMAPLWHQRASQLAGEGADVLEVGAATGAAIGTTMAAVAARKNPQAVVGAFVVGFLGVVLTELLMSGHERAALAASEKADAEALMLLKDPQQMLTALSDVLQADNTVPLAGEAYSSLFFCWAGSGYAPEDDPEMERIGRLREVIGAMGASGA